jgi:hypothetical protein
MTQRFKDIHRDLVIADQWTEPHSPWQNPAELNGVKYFMLKYRGIGQVHQTIYGF